jgi:hypothetical protein
MKSLPFWFIMFAALFALAGMGFGNLHGRVVGPHAVRRPCAQQSHRLRDDGPVRRLLPSRAGCRDDAACDGAFVGSARRRGADPDRDRHAILGQSPLLVQVSSTLVIVSMLIFTWTVFANRGALNAT